MIPWGKKWTVDTVMHMLKGMIRDKNRAEDNFLDWEVRSSRSRWDDEHGQYLTCFSQLFPPAPGRERDRHQPSDQESTGRNVRFNHRIHPQAFSYRSKETKVDHGTKRFRNFLLELAE